MIAKSETFTAKDDIWKALAAPLPADAIQWRQDGRPVNRDGRSFARFVAYVDAHFVHERFDAVVPGEWDSHLELLPPAVTTDGEEVEPFAFKCKLRVLGVIREDVGTGKDYKSAASDAFKRAAVRFGIAKELYGYGQNWVPMDGDGKYAKPVEDPGVVYRRKHGQAGPKPVTDGQQDYGARPTTASSSSAESSADSGAHAYSAASHGESELPPDTQRTDGEESCPKCGGRMWDNRLTKRNPKAPDYKCRDRACDGVIWPPKPARKPVVEDEEEVPY